MKCLCRISHDVRLVDSLAKEETVAMAMFKGWRECLESWSAIRKSIVVEFKELSLFFF